MNNISLNKFGAFGEKMKAAMGAKKGDENAPAEPVFSGENIRAALLGDARHDEHDIDPRIINDWLNATQELGAALIESETFGYIEKDDGTKEVRETSDGHILLSRLVWAMGTQVEYHQRNLERNSKLIQDVRDRAAGGLEIDMNRLAGYLRFRGVTEASLAFWGALQDDLKALYGQVTGSPYRDKKSSMPLASEAAKAMVEGLDEILGKVGVKSA